MKTLKVCILTTFLYFITFMVAARVFRSIYHSPIDLARSVSGPFIGIFLITIPYVFNGLYCRKVFSNPFKGALTTSIILTIGERVLIFLIGYLLVQGGGDGSMRGITVMMFIQGEAAPYYTLSYIIMGVFSICISVLISSPGKLRLFMTQ